jgi:hypothetical protein
VDRAVVRQADVAVRTHPQHRHADDPELSGYRFIDPPNRQAAWTRAEADDRIDRRARAPFELCDQLADLARVRMRTAEDDQRVAPTVGELVKRARIAVHRFDEPSIREHGTAAGFGS